MAEHFVLWYAISITIALRRQSLEGVHSVGSNPPLVKSMPSLASSFSSASSDPPMATPARKARQHMHPAQAWNGTHAGDDDPASAHVRMVSMPSACAALRFLHSCTSRTSAHGHRRGKGVATRVRFSRERERAWLGGFSHSEVVQEDRFRGLESVALAREKIDARLGLPAQSVRPNSQPVSQSFVRVYQ